MIKKLILAMGLLGLFAVCKGQEKTKPVTAMPKGKLLELRYNYSGMRIPEFGNYDLKRSADSGESEFSFNHYNRETSVKGVPDSVFTAAYRIIEEERMYEYGRSYRLPPELEQGLLDGFSWDFEVVFESGERISSYGRHVMPGGGGLGKIERLLYDVAKANVKDEPME